MTKMRKPAARRRERLAGLLLLFYMVSLLMGQICMPASALDTGEDASLVSETVATDSHEEPAATETANDPETAASENTPGESEQLSKETAPDFVLEDDFVKKPLCGLEAHEHSDACYDRDGFLICGMEAHEHDEMCYPACGIEAHSHDEDCYDLDGNLICEKEEHVHDEVYCYADCGIEEHVHTTACLDNEGTLACGKERHVHDKGCCPVPKDKEEKDDQDDAEEQEDSNRLPTHCGLPEHDHDDSCYDEAHELICGKVMHHHGRDCYLVSEEPTETEPSEPTEPTEPVETAPEETEEPEERTLYCGKEEHVHSESCDGENGELICGLEAHVHDDSCYVNSAEVQPEEKPLYCGKEEHVHSESCDGENGELTCGKEAHVHDDSCYVNPDAPVTYCGLSEHTHDESCMDESGNIVCGKREHTHDDNCYVPVYCGHVAHKHDALCLGEDGELVCGLEAHTHEESCYIEVPEGYALTCGLNAHTHGDACYDEEGNLVCALEEHTHTEDCFSPILEGTVYYPVADASQLDPDTAYLIMGQQEEETCLLTADLDTLPVAVVEGVDAEGTPCVQLSFGEPVAMMAALSLDDADEAEDETTLPEKETDSEAETETEELADDLKWVPDETDSQTLSNVKDTDTQVALAAADDGQITVVLADNTVLSSMNEPMLLAAENEAEETTGKFPIGYYCHKDVCHHEENYLTWTQYGHEGDDLVYWNMNPFGDARNYNLFLLGDFDGYGDTFGNAAIAGDILHMNNKGLTQGAGLPDYSSIITPKYDVGLLLGGTAAEAGGNVSVFNGSVISRDETNIDMDFTVQDGDSYHNYVPPEEGEDKLAKYFADAKADLEWNNARIYNIFTGLSETDSHLGQVNYLSEADLTEVTGGQGTPGTDLILTGTSHEYNVFNIPASMLTSVGTSPRELYLDVPFGSYVVINIEGEGATSLESFGMSIRYRDSNGDYIHQPADKTQNDDYKQTQRTFINFDPNITSVNVDSNSFIYASILAPKVDIKTGTAQVCFQGNVVFHDLTGNEEKTATSNSILINPFQTSGAASFRKFVMCESQEQDCKICEENTKLTDGTAWADYMVDLTLISIDDVGSPRTFELNDLKLDGSLWNNAAKLYLAPGDYRVQVETVYKKDADGNYVPVDENDEIFQNHFFSQVYFTRDKTLPEDLSFIDSKNLVLNIAPDAYEDETIINVYNTNGNTTRVSAVKRWVQDVNGKQTLVDAPTDASVQFRLYAQLFDEDGNSTGEPAIVPTTITSDSLVTVNADTHWFTEWSNLPLTMEIDGNTYTVKYFVKEEKGYTGWGEVTNPNEDLAWYQNTDTKYSPCEVGVGDPICQEDHQHDLSCYSSTQWVIKNENGTNTVNLTVYKQWTDPDGNELSGDALPAVQVQLYRYATDDSVTPTTNEIFANGTPYGEPVWLSDVNTWHYTWEDLPKKAAGTPAQTYRYAVKELTDIPGYTVSYGDLTAAGEDQVAQTITNKQNPPDGTVSVQKQWQSATGSIIDPPENATATFQLYQQKGTKKVVGDTQTVSVTISLSDGTNTKSETYQVKPGTTFDYSFTFWHDATWGSSPFTQKPETATVTSLFSGGWISGLGGSYGQTQASGSMTVNEATELTFITNKTIYMGDTITDSGYTISPPEFSADYEGLTYETTWETSWTAYSTVTLSGDKWSYTWDNLPTEDDTYVYRYYVAETACSPAGYTPSYSFNGVALDNPEDIPEDSNGGVMLVTNRTQAGGPELPKAGGRGTALYTMGGLLFIAAAGLLMYYRIKRRKEDFASS